MFTGVAPSGVVTFLFTDVEGSTRRWEADADAMRAALAAHDDVLRSAIEANGGFLIKHTGDGAVAAFSSPRAAVNAAIAAQRELELPVRMGLATGEAELRDGDYFGAVLNRAARIMSTAHGGQILVAESTAVLVSGIDLVNLGPRRLRDVPMPVGVYQVRAPGLATDFPALRALDTTPGNLRPATTSLIGREAAVADIAAAVKARRLVTLTGVGGVGKTRLALEVAARLADEYPDGVWVFELAAVTDPAAVPDMVASVLGVIQQPGKSVSESLAAALEGRVRLLVFDNCEHVLDAAADLIEAILAQSATVRILATSREGLGVPDEQVWPVRSLDSAAGIDSAAVRLFVERAQGTSAGFSLVDGGEAAAVTEICQRLDGIPLAIELAASRMASMTASEMRDRLDHRFRLLVGSRRGLERHQTLRHAVAWSYDLLDGTEKTLLGRCSVFAGGFDLQSACAVAGSAERDEYAVLEALDALVRKSLVLAARSGGRTRYSMLETIRQFAEEQLVTCGAAEAVRTAHARYFAGREADVMDLWDSPRQRESYDWFAMELANLRTAFRWAADHADVDAGATIAACSAFLGFLVENYEPLAWAEEMIEPARAVNHPRLAPLCVMASQCFFQGRIEEAVGYSDIGASVIAGGGDTAPYDAAESWLGSSYLSIGQPERSVELCRARLSRGGRTNTATWASLILWLTVTGANDQAMVTADGLIDAAEAIPNPCELAYALLAYGWVFRDTDADQALKAQRRGLAIAQDSGNRLIETQLLMTLSGLAAQHGNPLEALEFSALAIRKFHESGNVGMLHLPLALLAAFLDRLGRYEAATTIAGFAALNPVTVSGFPELVTAVTHLREVLTDQTYESLARKGEAMTVSAIVTYTFDQIDQARAGLDAISK
ncbi:adenylate/guanylate cyclase domain-containing protein [Mycobacterium sp. E2479]|uniref:ATP-binding protein n=1 Tax=Mycobacterium sp. E2479 TaxID=1834134 RepID=UPI000801950C|nr:adenylate/guanylate cyclase domain-containing protein [Mycobacterium sp. E2479]OBH53809.1 cyclase [Mycobacterium sp. E2479]